MTMTNQVNLYVIETDPDRAARLKVEMAHLTQVTVLKTYADAVAASGGLDAILVSLMSALDWGVIKPPVPVHQTQVIKMPEAEVARGRPRYAIPGVATFPDEILDPAEATRLVIQESFKAIYKFNEDQPNKLRTVGASALSLGLDKLRAGEAVELLSDVYLTSVA